MNQKIMVSSNQKRRRAVDRTRRAVGCFALSVVCAMFIGSAASAQAKGLQVELNKLEEVENGCRAFLVFENASDHLFSAFKIDLVLFDRKGVISKRLAVDAAPVRPRKTMVKMFDIQGASCADTERILINDVIECHDSKAERLNCVSLVTPTSRASSEFFK